MYMDLSTMAITMAIMRRYYGPVHKTQVDLSHCNRSGNSNHPSDLAKELYLADLAKEDVGKNYI